MNTTQIKTYNIELTLDELEFIRNSLEGINEFLKFLHGDHFTKFELFQYQTDTMIDPEELADKVFKQYHDGNGDLL